MQAEDMFHGVRLDALLVEFTTAVALLDNDARDGVLPREPGRGQVLQWFTGLLAKQDQWGAPVPLWEGRTTLAAFFDLAVLPTEAGCALGDELLRIIRSEPGGHEWSEGLLRVTGIGFRVVFEDVARFIDQQDI
ncbi:hypothetical protein AB0D66_30855 [Streptomyces sp. NPDC048270]|uniref:hypothetical protein n=1 Tax=Streptomyces sp. NPDC048270 TaxID=3154615 RepID=UPI0033EA9145